MSAVHPSPTTPRDRVRRLVDTVRWAPAPVWGESSVSTRASRCTWPAACSRGCGRPGDGSTDRDGARPRRLRRCRTSQRHRACLSRSDRQGDGMASSRTTRPAAALASLVPVLLLLAACGSGGDPDQPTTTSTSTPATPTSEAATPTPSVTVTSGRPTAAPAQVVTAGAVAVGAPAQVAGVGNAAVTYTRGGEFAVVGPRWPRARPACRRRCSRVRAGGPRTARVPARSLGRTSWTCSRAATPSSRCGCRARRTLVDPVRELERPPGTTGPQSGTGSTVLRMRTRAPMPR